MFLIDHDQAKVAVGQKERRARADDQFRPTFGDHLPRSAAFRHGDPRMPFGGAGPEAVFDPGEKFGRQRDFGEEDQRLPPGF